MISAKELKQRDFAKEWAWNDIEKNIVYRASCGFYSGMLFFKNGNLVANIENLKLSEEEVVTTLRSLGYRCEITQTSSNESCVHIVWY